MNNDTNRCYFVKRYSEVNHEQAKEKCAQLGAALASVGDYQERDFIKHKYAYGTNIFCVVDSHNTDIFYCLLIIVWGPIGPQNKIHRLHLPK